MDPNNKALTIRLNFRIICVVLLIIIAAMTATWRPWQDAPNTDRKITVTGEATTKSEPDEYQFNPLYERDTTAEITQLNSELIAGLKKLGVQDKQIKNNASRYGSPDIYYQAPVDGKETSTLNLTITLNDKKMVQKVQDYLLTTNPAGSITPYASFSTNKRKQLQDSVRDKAVADARNRAERTAEGLSAKLGKVQQVDEGQSGGVYPMLMSGSELRDANTSAADGSLSIQPGQDELSYSVTVTFLLK